MPNTFNAGVLDQAEMERAKTLPYPVGNRDRCKRRACLHHQKPSVNLDHLSLNKASLLGTEKDHDFGNVA